MIDDKYRSWVKDSWEKDMEILTEPIAPTTELEPCPFYRSKPIRSDCISCGYVQILCPECSANISIILRNNKDSKAIRLDEEELIKRWNRRA